MDGKGCWRDNVFIERVWRSIKYEEVYLHAYETVRPHAKASADTSTFTTRAGRTRVSKLEPRTWCTSHRCIRLRPTQPDHAGSTYVSSESVQINGARSDSRARRYSQSGLDGHRNGVVFSNLWCCVKLGSLALEPRDVPGLNVDRGTDGGTSACY